MSPTPVDASRKNWLSAGNVTRTEPTCDVIRTSPDSGRIPAKSTSPTLACTSLGPVSVTSRTRTSPTSPRRCSVPTTPVTCISPTLFRTSTDVSRGTVMSRSTLTTAFTMLEGRSTRISTRSLLASVS